MPDIAFGSRLALDRTDDADASALERLLAAVSCSVSSCGWYEFPAGWSIPARSLDVHVAYIAVAGELALGFEGDGAGDEQPRVVHAGEVFVTWPGQRHRVWAHGPGALRLLTVHFSARIHDVLDMPAVFGLPQQSRPMPEGFERIVASTHDILDALDSRAPGSALDANAACARFVAGLWREAVVAGGGGPVLDSTRARDLVRLAPVFRVIHERYAERPAVAQLADVIHLEPDYFAALFKRVTGSPPHAYLTAYRLGRVRALLATTDEPVGAIAAQTGFGDSFYLSRAFRRSFGMTPSAYRKTRNSPDLP